MKKFQVTPELVIKVVDAIRPGLVNDVGDPVPGQMCVEAAVCYALGEPHGDTPSCVENHVRRVKIDLNDTNWTTDKARARGLVRVAIAQLGSKGKVKPTKFYNSLIRLCVAYVPPVLVDALLRPKLDISTAARKELREIKEEMSDAWTNKDHRKNLKLLTRWSRKDGALEDHYYMQETIETLDDMRTKTIPLFQKESWIESLICNFNNLGEYTTKKNPNTFRILMADLIELALEECGSPGCDYLYMVR